MIDENLVKKYLDEKRHVWSRSTFKSESARLHKLLKFVNYDPLQCLKKLRDSGYKPYTIKTMLIRLARVKGWAIENGLSEPPNTFQDFMKNNPQVFKNAYEKKTITKTYDSVKKDIESANWMDAVTKDTALFLLRSGIRISELYSTNVDSQGAPFVRGKGNRVRRIFAKPPEKIAKETDLRAALKKLDLTPHDLRRLFATKLMNSGFSIHDVAKATGHESIQTLMKYLQNTNDEVLEKEILNVV